MLSFGENGWIKYGWTSQLNRERNYKDNLYIKLEPNYTPSSPNELGIDVAVKCVKKISQTYPPPYNLMCSGGTDSQAMIYSWMKSGIPFNIISVKYISNNIWWNHHDLVTLDQFCQVNNLKVEFKDFDIIDFLEHDLYNISKTYECPSPQISTHIKMTDLVPSGTIIFSGNFIERERTTVTLAQLGVHKFSLYKNRQEISVIPFFFLEYPNLAYAFSRSIAHKNDNYVENGFPIIPQSEKFTGFEKLKNYYDKYSERVTPKDRLKFAMKPSKRVFDLIFRYPYEGAENYKVIHVT
jgi:hypothetical protein